MGKSNKDWRNGNGDGNYNSKKGRKHDSQRQRDDYYPQEERPRQTDRPRQQKSNRPSAPKDPIADMLMNEYRDNVKDFIEASDEARDEMLDTMFKLPTYPAMLEADEERELKAYQLTRSVGHNNNFYRISANVLVVNEDGSPAYFVDVYATVSETNRGGNVRVTRYDEKGMIPGGNQWWKYA